MIKLSGNEVVFILAALVDHVKKIKRKKPYRKKDDNLKMYTELVDKFTSLITLE